MYFARRLVAGSSLMVWSGYRFVRRARERGIDVAVVNLGRTRADGEVTLKLPADCGETLEKIARGETLLNQAADRS